MISKQVTVNMTLNMVCGVCSPGSPDMVKCMVYGEVWDMQFDVDSGTGFLCGLPLVYGPGFSDCS